MKELDFLFVTQFMPLEPSKVTTQNGEEWGTFYRQFLIPQTATFSITMDAKRNSSFAAKIKKRSKKHEKYVQHSVLREHLEPLGKELTDKVAPFREGLHKLTLL